MFFENISYITVAIAAIVSVGFGFIWYSPWLFGKRYMKEMGISASEVAEAKAKGGKEMSRMYAMSFALSLATAFVVSSLLGSLIVVSLWGLVLVGFMMWLGFSLPVAANGAIYGKDSLVLFAINSGYQLLSLVLVSVVVGIFG
ncbi:MAG: DUF1761 domain-containing protein [Candidatus Taylorbacteria bacterium]|nr:DUF1761 domain-containing protein [Candidatus Taylorbacteria bacterium]